MKQLDKIRQEISELQTIADNWAESGSLSNIERDLMLKKLRHLYDAVLFAQTNPQLDYSSAEEESHTEPLAVAFVATQEPHSEPQEPATEEPQEAEPEEEELSRTIAPETQESDAEQESIIAAPEVEISPEEQTFEPEQEHFEEDEEIFVLDDMLFIDEQADEILNEPDFEAIEQPKEQSVEYIDKEADKVETPIREQEPEIEEEPAVEQEPETEEETEIEEESAVEQEPEIEEAAASEEPENEVVEVVEVEKQPAAPQSNIHQQSNLFDIDSYTTPRRSHRRLMSLYDEEIFEHSEIASQSANEPLISEVVIEEQTPKAESVSYEEKPRAIEPQNNIEERVVTSEAEQYIEKQVVEEVEIEASVSPADSFTISEQTTPSEEIEINEIAYESSNKSNEHEPQSVANVRQSEPTPVLGDVMMSDKQILGDTIAKTAAQTTAEFISHASINTLREALGINDRYTIITELFGGNEELCDKALTMLDEQESLEDAIIFIETNFSWHPSSEAANMIMEILERKFS